MLCLRLGPARNYSHRTARIFEGFALHPGGQGHRRIRSTGALWGDETCHVVCDQLKVVRTQPSVAFVSYGAMSARSNSFVIGFG